MLNAAGIFTYKTGLIWANVGTYTVHGAYGYGRTPAPVDRWFIPRLGWFQHVSTAQGGARFLPSTVAIENPSKMEVSSWAKIIYKWAMFHGCVR